MFMLFYASTVDFSDYDLVWSFLVQLGVLLIALLIGNMLRTRIPFLKRTLVPSALIGGLLLLLLKLIPAVNQFLDNNIMQIITYHCLGFGFTAMALKTAKTNKKVNKTKIIENGVLQGGTYMLQAILGLAITITWYLFTKDTDNAVFFASGIILPLGFGQGPGNALAWDNNFTLQYPDLFSGNGSFGLTIACVGFIVASIVGVLYMNILRHKGKLIIREVAKGDNRSVADFEGDNEIPSTESVDKFSLQICLVFLVYAISFGLMCLLQQISDFTGSIGWGFNFLWGTIGAYIYKFIYTKLKKVNIVKRDYTNNYLMDRISGFMFDLMIIAGVAAIQFDDVKRYIIPLILLCSAGTIGTYLYIYFGCKQCFKGYENEAFLANFGTLTGTASNGMILLREIDPNYETPAASNLVLQQFPAMVVIAPLLLMLASTGRSLKSCLICFIIYLILFTCYTLFLYRRKLFKKYYSLKKEETWTHE